MDIEFPFLEIQLETLKFAQIMFYFVDITSKYLYHLCFGLYSFYGFDWFYYPFVDSQVSTMNERLELDSILFFKYTILIHVQCLSSTLEAICTLYSPL